MNRSTHNLITYLITECPCVKTSLYCRVVRYKKGCVCTHSFLYSKVERALTLFLLTLPFKNAFTKVPKKQYNFNTNLLSFMQNPTNNEGRCYYILLMMTILKLVNKKSKNGKVLLNQKVYLLMKLT